MGDGLLLEFPSVVDATACAIAVQEGIALRNAEVPEDRRIAFRIGVNLGDIIIEGDDILGDGVNIAARLEALAEPGGVAISGRIYEDVRDRLDAAFADTGEQSLKNIARPIRVWHWFGAAEEASAASTSLTVQSQTPLDLSLPDKPSIAVLPFENRSGDPEQEFFADGMAEDIISALSQFDSLFVIARNSTFSFKGQTVSTAEVSEALDVRYVIDDSIRKAGNRIRVAAQLVDASSGSPIWAERYDRDLEDIFAVQDEITEAIVGAVAPEIDEAESRLAKRKSPENLDIWSRYQLALASFYSSTQDGIKEAIRRCDEINVRAPKFAQAYAVGSNARCRYTAHFGNAEIMLQEAEEKTRIAVKLEPQSHLCVNAIARVYSYRELHGMAITKAQEAVSLNSNHAFSAYSLGFFLYRSERCEEAIVQLDRAIRLSPRDSFAAGFFGIRGICQFCLGRYEEAAEWTLRSCNAPNPRPNLPPWAIASLQKIGRYQEAKALLSDYQRRTPEAGLNAFRDQTLEMYPEVAGSIDTLLDALREAGMPE